MTNELSAGWKNSPLA